MSLEFSTLRTKFSDGHSVVSIYIICGDPKVRPLLKTMLKENDLHWFPMRIRHSSLSRLEQMIERFDKEKTLLGESFLLDTYVPLNFIRVSMTKLDFAPYLLNYIFVYSTFQNLVQLKHDNEAFEPLRFVMHPVYDDDYTRRDEVLTVSDKVMADYMRMTAEANDKIVFLRDLKFACKPSREVQIIEGQFTGVIGRVKRIRGARCVVLPIGEEQAAAVIDVPNSMLRYLTDDEIRKLKGETTHMIKH